jgi:hypothetical protein
MSLPLNLQEVFARWPATVTPLSAPPELWSRITIAHRTRSRRRRALQVLGSASVVLVMAAIAVGMQAWRAHDPASQARINWQARAQALELQLDTLPLPPSDASAAVQTQSELARVDGYLQAAYDRGGAADEIGPLWQRRSELLDALLALRRQQNSSTRT